MITFVYCCICLLIVCCQTTRTESEENDYNNDSPDTLPKVTSLAYKFGADIIMKCNNHYPNKDNITWEFKHCKSNHEGIQCDDNDMYKLDYSEGQWKKLDFNRKRKKLEIKNATEESVGLYRCLYNDSIIKIYMVDVVVTTKYDGPRPEIVTLSLSNSTIQCKATSVMPAEIRWFKDCGVMGCDANATLLYNGQCYCGIVAKYYAYSTDGTIYISKLNIHKTNFESGTYVCLVMSSYGEDHKNITFKTGDTNAFDNNEHTSNSFSLLFLIPLFFALVPIAIWVGFCRGKRKSRRKSVNFNENQKQLIKPIVEI